MNNLLKFMIFTSFLLTLALAFPAVSAYSHYDSYQAPIVVSNAYVHNDYNYNSYSPVYYTQRDYYFNAPRYISNYDYTYNSYYNYNFYEINNYRSQRVRHMPYYDWHVELYNPRY